MLMGMKPDHTGWDGMQPHHSLVTCDVAVYEYTSNSFQ